MMIRLLSILAFVAACTEAPHGPRSAAGDVDILPVWPEPDATFVHPILEVPAAFGTPGVFVVAGHGAPGNEGNLGCRCQREQDFTLASSTDLARRLDSMGVFDVTVARKGDKLPSYPARLRHLARSGAEVMLELHSDYRGRDFHAVDVADDGRWCMRADDDPGMAILVSDQGSDALNAARIVLARQVAMALSQTGFLMYDGYAYGGLYQADSTEGVFLDRRGLMMLRRPKVPSILIETHNAMDGEEVARWSEGRTRDAFGRAIADGLLHYFAER